MRQLVEIVAILVVGPLLGSEFAVAAFVHPIAGRLPDDGFRAARGDAARRLGRVMPFWYGAALVLLLGSAVAAGGSSWPVGAAAGLMLGVLALSVGVMVPINNRIAACEAGGELSRELAARWDRLHWLRVTALAVIFALLVAVRFA